LQQATRVAIELGRVDAFVFGEIGLKFAEGFAQLAGGPDRVAAGGVIGSHGDVDEGLEEEAARRPFGGPRFLPDFVSMEEVAAFYFTSVADSYAGRTDRPQNVGVIGVAVYREAEPLPPPPQPAVSARERSDQGGADRAAANNAPPNVPGSAAPARGDALSKQAEGRPWSVECHASPQRPKIPHESCLTPDPLLATPTRLCRAAST